MATAPAPSSTPSLLDSKISKRPGRISLVLFALVLIAGVTYAAVQLLSDLSVVHNASVLPYVLLGVALLIALEFEFVNGFHDTANAVATSIYTHAMEPNIAVMGHCPEHGDGLDLDVAGLHHAFGCSVLGISADRRIIAGCAWVGTLK